jgi:hypothetical protein
MSLRYIAVLVVSSLTCTTVPIQGAVIAWTAVVVRVYDANGVIAGTNRQALDHARKTLEAASIDVIWRICPSHPSCNAPLTRGELAIRIVRLPVPPSYSGSLPLGDAMVDTHARTGVLATIYIDRIEWLAHEAGADSRGLLGNAIAHELGHLLMATTTHGPVGLMRSHWSQEEVRRAQPRDWSFAPTELAAMRRRVEARERDVRLVWGTR